MTTQPLATPPAKDRSGPITGALALVVVVVLFVLTPVEAQLWVTALHVVAVISWMAGMLYLPRLLVYHAESGPARPSRRPSK